MTTAIGPDGRRKHLRVDAQGRLLVKVSGTGTITGPGAVDTAVKLLQTPAVLAALKTHPSVKDLFK